MNIWLIKVFADRHEKDLVKRGYVFALNSEDAQKIAIEAMGDDPLATVQHVRALPLGTPPGNIIWENIV